MGVLYQCETSLLGFSVCPWVRGRAPRTLKNEERKEMKNLGWADVAGIAVVWIMAVVIVILVKESSVAIAAISIIFAAILSDRIITRGDKESEN